MQSVFSRTRRSRIADLVVFAAIILVIFAVLWILPTPDPLRVTGHARVIDGDSIVVQGTEIRLEGVDAPEMTQLCSRKGEDWNCGRQSARALSNFLRRKVTDCVGRRRDAHDRLLAVCKATKINVNRWLVSNGWAVSFHDFSGEEAQARKAKRGIWSGTFVRPSEWREENR